MILRALDPRADRLAVAHCLSAAQDYYHLWMGRGPLDHEVDGFFTDCPPGCDAALSLRLGAFEGEDLLGVAEVSFGFPEKDDAYLGLMILALSARNRGVGAWFLGEIENTVRARGHRKLFLGVLEANPSGARFWARMGFSPTGIARQSCENGIAHITHRLCKTFM